jgi:hypothetical protein
MTAPAMARSAEGRSRRVHRRRLRRSAPKTPPARHWISWIFFPPPTPSKGGLNGRSCQTEYPLGYSNISVFRKLRLPVARPCSNFSSRHGGDLAARIATSLSATALIPGLPIEQDPNEETRMRKLMAIIVALGFAGAVTLPQAMAAPAKSKLIQSDELSSASHEKKDDKAMMEKKPAKKKAAKKTKKKKKVKKPAKKMEEKKSSLGLTDISAAAHEKKDDKAMTEKKPAKKKAAKKTKKKKVKKPAKKDDKKMEEKKS